MILLVKSISSLGRIAKYSRNKEFCFHFLVFGVERFTVKLIEKQLEKALVVWALDILSLLDLVKTRSRVCP